MTASAARLESLTFRDFRNFERLELAVPQDGLAIIGNNGQGKTNLLEGIYYLQLLRSARGARDADLLRFGAEGFHLSGRLQGGHTIGVGFDRATRRKRVSLDSTPVRRLSEAIGALPAVLVSPADVELVAGAPVVRRRYLDVLLALTSKAYLTALQAYRATLLQRNAALREVARSGRGEASVRIWDAPLAQAGAVIWQSRSDWVSRVASRFTSLCTAIGENGTAELAYATSLDVDADTARSLLAAFESSRATDARHGMTHAGPHRDDLAIVLDGHDLRTFGSAGQQRSAAIALRLLEWETLREARAVAPMLLLDDPFAELDPTRSARIVALLSGEGLGQTVLTVPSATDIPLQFTRLERRQIDDGRITNWSAA